MHVRIRSLFVPVAGLVLSIAAQAPAAEKVKIVIDGSTSVGPIAKAFAGYAMEKNPNVHITVSESGSGNGAKSLLNGTCDIADMSRFMKPNEFAAAVGKGVLPVAHVVAIDGIAVIVHPGNPIAGLTLDQIRNIYAGKITRWSQLGGPNSPIVVISRDTNSGTFETFESLVMRGEKVASGAEYVGSNGQMRQRVQSTAGAMGYVGIGFLDRAVKSLKVDNMAPDMGEIATGHYPIARPLFMFTNGYPRLGTALHAFVTLHLTPKGQEIIESIGFVPVTRY